MKSRLYCLLHQKKTAPIGFTTIPQNESLKRSFELLLEVSLRWSTTGKFDLCGWSAQEKSTMRQAAEHEEKLHRFGCFQNWSGRVILLMISKSNKPVEIWLYYGYLWMKYDEMMNILMDSVKNLRILWIFSGYTVSPLGRSVVQFCGLRVVPILALKDDRKSLSKVEKSFMMIMMITLRSK